MDIFGDKKYEELDWLVKAVEPIEYNAGKILAALPAEFIISIDDIPGLLDTWNMNISYNRAIMRYIYPLKAIHNMNDNEWNEISSSYILYVEGRPVVDFEINQIRGGTLKLIKDREGFTENELKEKMGIWGRKVHIDSIATSEANLERLTEVLDLIGSTDGLRKRTAESKLRVLSSDYHVIMQQNKWNIRSIDLADKIAMWMKLYIVDGNIPSMMNLCKIKVITHRGYPIYEIEEEAL